MNEIEELIEEKMSNYEKLTCNGSLSREESRYCSDMLWDLGEIKQELTNSKHESVEVPDFIKNVMQQYNSLQEMLTEEYYSDSSDEIGDDAVFCWIDENFDLLCRAWLDGCTVAKEPLYFWRLKLHSIQED